MIHSLLIKRGFEFIWHSDHYQELMFNKLIWLSAVDFAMILLTNIINVMLHHFRIKIVLYET